MKCFFPRVWRTVTAVPTPRVRGVGGGVRRPYGGLTTAFPMKEVNVGHR